MDKREIRDYIKQNIEEHSFQEIKSSLISGGVREEDIESAFKKILRPRVNFYKITAIILSLIIIAILAVSLVFYFMYISPKEISKPHIDKPKLNGNATAGGNASKNAVDEGGLSIGPQHIIFLLNEIGFYSVHGGPSGDIPLLEFKVSTPDKRYYFTVNDGVITETQPGNADIQIEASQDALIAVYNAANTKDTILQSYQNGEIKIQVIGTVQSLALKGYKSIYDSLGITGGAVGTYFQKDMFYVPLLAILLIGFFLVLCIKKYKHYSY